MIQYKNDNIQKANLHFTFLVNMTIGIKINYCLASLIIVQIYFNSLSRVLNKTYS